MAGDTERFERLAAQLLEISVRPEISIADVPAPQRLAPYALAIAADVAVDGDDVATGRFVMLHDPAGQEAWDGTFRCVTFVRSAIESEMQSDPLLAEVAWSWIVEGLEGAGAAFTATSGTVTRVASASFGQLAETEDSAEIEIRASWTPRDSDGLISHFNGWLHLIEMASGLTPIAEGVSALKKRR